MEFENFSSVKAKTRRSTPVEMRASTWAFTFSTPASANTTGVVSEGVAPRLASSQHGHAVHRRECIGDSPRQDPSREVVDHRVHVGASPVEQTDDGGVDVPHLVGSRRAKAHLRLGRMHAEPGAAPAELPHQVVPGRGGRPDRAEPLRQDGERPGRDMPVFERGHHVLDRQDLGSGQSMGRRVRTGRLIVKRTRVLLASPGMESTRGQSQEPQERPQRHKLAGAIHGSQEPCLRVSAGQALVRQREPRASKQGEGEPKECRELLHASPELQDFLPEFRFLQVRHVAGSPRPSVPCGATHGPSSEGPRDPWRWPRPRCPGRDPEADGRSAAEGAPWSSWG